MQARSVKLLSIGVTVQYHNRKGISMNKQQKKEIKGNMIKVGTSIDEF